MCLSGSLAQCQGISTGRLQPGQPKCSNPGSPNYPANAKHTFCHQATYALLLSKLSIRPYGFFININHLCVYVTLAENNCCASAVCCVAPYLLGAWRCSCSSWRYTRCNQPAQRHPSTSTSPLQPLPLQAQHACQPVLLQPTHSNSSSSKVHSTF
jgi:hypothetical protein